MKRIFYVLPLSALLTYCSSTRPAIAPGLSNVQVNGQASSTSATNENRDWGYRASRDTALNGTWQLAGMMTNEGSWKTAEGWQPIDSSMMEMDSATQGAMSATGKAEEMASTSKSFGGKLYDTSTHFFDTAAFKQTLADKVQPYKYWQRLPELKIMADLGIFTGNTGCNSMSGSFNFSQNDIKINPNIRTSKMACNEYDENAFVGDLLKVDNYTINNGMLELKQGNTTLLTFSKSS